MGLFDDGMAFAAEMSSAVMGEDMTINGVPVRGTRGPQVQSSSHDAERGGKVKEIEMEVHLTVSEAEKALAIKGSKVTTANGLTARVADVEDLGSAGVILRCGPVNREQG